MQPACRDMCASPPKPDGDKSSSSSGVFAPGGHDSAHVSRHMLDLTDLFRANDQKMPDSMVTEVRRHLEVAVTTVQTGMMFGLRLVEHTPELQSQMRSSYAVFCLNRKHIDLRVAVRALHHSVTAARLCS